MIGAQAFTSLIPFLLISSVLGPGSDRTLSERLIDRFDLHGSAARNVSMLFNDKTEVESTVTWVSVVILVVSALSFTRAVQRMFQRAYEVPSAGPHQDAGRGLLWLGLFVVWLTVASSLRPSLDDAGGPVLVTGLGTVLGFVVWLWTPRILLGPRVPWRRLAVGAAASGFAGFVVSVASVIVMPLLLTWSSDRYGLIGIAFGLQSWLLAVALVIVLGAVVGAAAGERLEAS